VFAPWPPARTGIADYAAAQLAALRRTAGPHTVEADPPACDAALYHLGNHPLHARIYARALREPGVVVLHDALLQHFYLGTLGPEEYVREFVYNYGAWHEDLARELHRSQAASGLRAELYRYPMLKRVAETARAVVVHNPAAARLVRAHAPGARVVEIPHLWQPPAHRPAVAEALRFRQARGIPPSAWLFGLFGYLRESKRVEPALAAFRTVRAAFPDLYLLVAGAAVSRDLPRAVAPLLAQAGVVRLGHLDEAEFWRAASACDAALNLRVPTAGETSGITIRLMGLGKPVVVSDTEENAAFPETACLRVSTGLAERAHLAEALRFLAGFRADAEEIGRRARAYVERVHDAEATARCFWQVLTAP
jgi:glycosyltransferase involved in cell wall biosynthesis